MSLPVAGRVLIVEDEALIALDLERTLSLAGVEVVGIRDDVASARAAIRDTAPDLVLLDIHLRGSTDGIALARELRDSDVAVVFLTAFGDDVTVRRAGEAHPHGFLVKPVDPRSLVATVRVALERLEAERQSRWLEQAVEAAQIAVMIADGGSAPQVVRVNEGFRKLAGLEPGTPISELTPCLLAADREGAEVSRMREAIVAGVPHSETVPCRDRRGRYFFSHVAVAPLGVVGGTPRVAVVHVDVTSRLSFEAALSDNQRLVLVGRLAAGLAHDLNNLLSVMVSFAELTAVELEESGERWHEQIEDLRQVVDAGQRAGLLSRRILGLARQHPESAPVELELGELAMASRRLLKQACGPDVTLDLDPGSGRLFVSADPVELEQVLLNLVTNARDANASRVRVAVVEPPAADESSSHQFACVQVEDDGAGMSAEVAARAFDPLFSTKGERGTGLGLYNAQTLLQRAGGDIRVTSTEGEGTCVELRFPRLSLVEGSKPLRDDAPRVEGVRCFVVEGDPAVRVAMLRVLRGAGATAELLAKDVATPTLGPHDVLICDARAVERRAAFDRCSPEERRRWLFLGTGPSSVPADSAWGAVPLLKPFSSAALVRRLSGIVASDTARSSRPLTPRPAPRPVVEPPSALTRPLVAARDSSRVLGILTADLDALLDGARASAHEVAAWMASTSLPLWVGLPRDDVRTSDLAPFAARFVFVVDAIRHAAEVERIAELRRVGYGVALLAQASVTDLAFALDQEPDYFVLPPEFTSRVVLSSGWSDLATQTIAALRRRGIDVVGREVRCEAEARALTDVGCDLLVGPRFAGRMEDGGDYPQLSVRESFG